MIGEFLEVVKLVRTELAKNSAKRITAQEAASRKQHLRYHFDEFKEQRLRQAEIDKAEAEQDLVSRGLHNSTVLDSKFRVIDTDASRDVERMHRELTEAEELVDFACARA